MVQRSNLTKCQVGPFFLFKVNKITLVVQPGPTLVVNKDSEKDRYDNMSGVDIFAEKFVCRSGWTHVGPHSVRL